MTTTSTTYSPPATQIGFLTEALTRGQYLQQKLAALLDAGDPIITQAEEWGAGSILLSGVAADLTSSVGPNGPTLGTPLTPDPADIAGCVTQALRRITAALSDAQQIVPPEAATADADIDNVRAALQGQEQGDVALASKTLAVWALRDIERAQVLLNNLITGSAGTASAGTASAGTASAGTGGTGTGGTGTASANTGGAGTGGAGTGAGQ